MPPASALRACLARVYDAIFFMPPTLQDDATMMLTAPDATALLRRHALRDATFTRRCRHDAAGSHDSHARVSR